MSLEKSRQHASSSQRNELTERLNQRRRSLRSFFATTRLVAKNAPLSTLINSRFDSENTPPPDSEEAAWLDSNDISCGLYFEDTSIPFPPTTQDAAPTYTSKPTRPSPQPPERVRNTSDAHSPTINDAVASTIEPASPSDFVSDTNAQRSTSAGPDSEGDDAIPVTYTQKASEDRDGPVAPPGLVAPPQPEDEAEFSDETQQLLDLESPQRPAKVVHLPPEEVQRERLREAEEERRRRSEDGDHTKPSRTHLHTQHELASSPSSTVGAYSATTPMPPQDSPDTSPDSETAEQIEVLPPKDLRPSSEELREKEEHDRILAAQKELARKQALGDVSSADDQLRWEERAANARDAEERAAREAVNGPEPEAKDESEETQAEEVMDDVERDNEEEQAEVSAERQEVKVVADRPTEPEAAQEDGDNITVARRSKVPLTIDTNSTQQTPMDAVGQATTEEHERMTTRTSSGVLQKRSVSEILGQTPSRREFLSPEGISPLMARHPQDTPAAGPPTTSLLSPRRGAQPPALPRTPSTSLSALEQLNVLKGAAQDPDRDYLEPLFRIQAHDSPNKGSSTLAELIRSSTKTLSTEDQFTSHHERVDYRLLRRIYQLQNANKWSLRQMERCKEPEQPVTHYDHMMVEMQWMRKDFKAERKMKKSVCAWLARRCADWVAASAGEREMLQIKVRPPKTRQIEDSEERTPDLDMSGESQPEDETGPPTPPNEFVVPSNLIIVPELSEAVSTLEKSGKLGKALESIPVTGLSSLQLNDSRRSSLTPVSKFVGGKVLPRSLGPSRKRSRYEYEDEAEVLESQPDSKRFREERDLPPEDQEGALFHPENKGVRDRLYVNNAFRPPSEFPMPSTQFYEFRNGSQWVDDDDERLKASARKYSFNWSLMADELQLPGTFKSSAERRTPWECFERWVELEQLPNEMRKTVYFKTWYQRLEQSQQAAERRYQAQVAALQAASNGQASHVPMRRRTIPTRVDKRKNSRYLWLVDAMRKLARKKEQHAYKQAEAHRLASQRKNQVDNNQPRAQTMLTPQEFSKKRYERDLQVQEIARAQRQKMMEAQQRQIMIARQNAQQQQQQGMQNGAANQQRPGSSSNMPAQQAQMQPNDQPQANMNGQLSQQARQSMPVVQRNGHLAVPQMNGQGIPQAQMRPNAQMPTPQELQRLAHAQAQARSQYGGQQQFPMPSANMMSPGSGGMSAQQLNQSSQAMLASMQQQMVNAGPQAGGNHQMSASPNMPPPPTPHNHPQSLSSGHVPALLGIKAQIRNKFPNIAEDQVAQMATEMLKNQSQSSSQARQSAMNAAAGINGGVNMQAYGHNQAAYQSNQMANGNNFMGGDVQAQQGGMSPTNAQAYASMMRQRQMAQMRMQQSPSASHATLNGSPGMANASPNMQPVSPNMQFSSINQMGAMNMGGINAQQQRPPSRSNTPQMQRLGSSGNLTGGMPSPQGVNGLQGSPRNMQASMAR